MLPSQKQHRQLNTNTFTADKPWFGHMTVLPVFQVLAMSDLIIRDSLTRSFTLFKKGALAKALAEATVYNKSHPAQLRLAVLLTVFLHKLLYIKWSLANKPLRVPLGIQSSTICKKYYHHVYNKMYEVLFPHNNCYRNNTGFNCTNCAGFSVSLTECFRLFCHQL